VGPGRNAGGRRSGHRPYGPVFICERSTIRALAKENLASAGDGAVSIPLL